LYYVTDFFKELWEGKIIWKTDKPPPFGFLPS
jgi:hypothetical protein